MVTKYKYTYNHTCKICNKDFTSNKTTTTLCSTACVTMNNSLNTKGVVRIDKDREDKFIELAGEGKSLYQIRKELDISHITSKNLANKHGYSHLIQSQETASKGRCLSVEDAQLKVLDGVVESFDQETMKYKIICADGFIYYKKTPHLSQGRPSRATPTYNKPIITTKKTITMTAPCDGNYSVKGETIYLQKGQSYSWEE